MPSEFEDHDLNITYSATINNENIVVFERAIDTKI